MIWISPAAILSLLDIDFIDVIDSGWNEGKNALSIDNANGVIGIGPIRDIEGAYVRMVVNELSYGHT